MVKSLYSKSLKLVLLSMLALQASSDIFAMEQNPNPNVQPMEVTNVAHEPNQKRNLNQDGDSSDRPKKLQRRDETSQQDANNQAPQVYSQVTTTTNTQPMETLTGTKSEQANNPEVAADNVGLTQQPKSKPVFSMSMVDFGPDSPFSLLEGDGEALHRILALVISNDKKKPEQTILELARICPFALFLQCPLNEITTPMTHINKILLDEPKALITLTMFKTAILNRHPSLEAIKYIIKVQPDLINEQDSEGLTLLHYLAFAYTGERNEVKDQRYASKLYYIKDAPKIIIMFLLAGADLNITNKMGHNPLHCALAVYKNTIPRIKLLEEVMKKTTSEMTRQKRADVARTILESSLDFHIAKAMKDLREAELIPEQDMSTGSDAPSAVISTTTTTTD